MILQRAAILRLLAVLCLAGAALQPAFAQTRAAVRNACQADVARLCADVKPGGGRVAACIKRQRMLVSSACDAALTKAGVK